MRQSAARSQGDADRVHSVVRPGVHAKDWRMVFSLNAKTSEIGAGGTGYVQNCFQLGD
jgi:hypothetical protein